MTLRSLLAQAREHAGADAVIELGRDVVERLDCPRCGKSEPVFKPLGTLRLDHAICPCDGTTSRNPVLFHQIDGSESFLDRTLLDAGIPPFDILTARGSARTIGLELAGDAPTILGALGNGGLTWT
jgi:hypothetical protein